MSAMELTNVLSRPTESTDRWRPLLILVHRPEGDSAAKRSLGKG
jgi:hypothetical protein